MPSYFIECFRRLVRKVILHNFWQHVFKASSDDLKDCTHNLYRRQRTSILLTREERTILSIPCRERTDEEKEKAIEIIMKLKSMSRFSPAERKLIANKLQYIFYKKGRTLIREGNDPTLCYFILTGEITYSKLVWDPIVQKDISKSMAIFGAGDIVGEISLILNTKRISTYETNSDSEMLCLFKEDFDEIIMPIIRKHWDQVSAIIERFSYFQHLTTNQVIECCRIAKFKYYRPDEIIYSEQKQSDFVFFIISGQCSVLYKLKVKVSGDRYKLVEGHEETNKNKSILTALSPEEDNPHIINEIMSVGYLSSGSVFGLKKTIVKNTAIVAKTSVECILIPRFWLFQPNQNIGFMWNRLEMILDKKIPMPEKLFKNFVNSRNWMKFRKNLITDISKLKETGMKITDVPIVCRLEYPTTGL